MSPLLLIHTNLVYERSKLRNYWVIELFQINKTAEYYENIGRRVDINVLR